MSDNNTHLAVGHPLHDKRIAIIGAGPAGLTLARLLQMEAVSVRVFERDAWANARLQGGSLDLHPESGQLALERCGLTGRFVAVGRPEGHATTIVDKRGLVHVFAAADEAERAQPEVDRGALRDLLLHSLVDDAVSWGRTLTEVRREGERYQLMFDDGNVEVFDIVVGADGSRSKVRPSVTSIASFYTGVTFVEARLSDIDTRHPNIARYVGPGHVLALSDNKGLLAQRNGDGSIRVYAARRCPEHWLAEHGIGLQDGASARQQLVGWFPDWAPELVDMVRRSDDRFLSRPLYAFPADQEWDARPGATLIGDAAHVIPPFLGVGANMAMLDAVELADHLVSDQFPSLAGAIATFERSMHNRMAPLVQGALATQELLFADDAPAALVKSFRDGGAAEHDELAQPAS